MAIYHLSVKIIGRKAGRSAVASAAYRSGTKLVNEHDYTNKKWIAYSEIMLPVQASESFKDREKL